MKQLPGKAAATGKISRYLWFRMSCLFLFHRNQFTVKLKVVLADGLVASELLMV